MFAGFGAIWRYRRILTTTTRNDLFARHVGTVGGLAWTVLYPLVFLALYAVIYLFVFRVRPVNLSEVDYLFVIFTGLVPFLGFAEAISVGVQSVTANKSLVKNTMFPVEMLPVKAVLTSSASMLVSLAILIAALVAHGEAHATQLLVVPLVGVNLVFTIGMVWIFSTVHVFLRDLGNMVPILVLFLMLVSPIAYTIDQVPPGVVPFLALNPLYYLITLYREVLLGKGPDSVAAGVFAAVAFAVFTVGYHFLVRLKIVFSEYV